MGWPDWAKWEKWGAESGGGADPRLPSDIPTAEGTALLWLYDNLDGANWDDNTNWGDGLLAANWAGITVAGGKVTGINLLLWADNGLNGDITNFQIDAFTALTTFIVGDNPLITGNIFGWTLPSTLIYLHFYGTGISGSITGYTIPSQLVVFTVDNTSCSGSISNMAIPAALYQFSVGDTTITGVPDFSAAEDLGIMYHKNCGLSQAEVDLYLSRVYARRAAFTAPYGTPSLQIHGTNATPSGIYQDGDPPTTGQEYAYELVNDPETEGFEKWQVLYTESWAIQGVIQDGDGAGLDGVTVSLTGDASDSTVTAGGGLYAFTNLANGSYTVTPSKVGSTFSPASDPITVADANETATTMAEVWEISGTITESGSPLVGVLVTLSGDASDTDTTDSNGDYSFPGLSNGSYTVTPTKTGYSFTPSSSPETVADADVDRDFTAAVSYTISGTIEDADANPISGVLVTLSGDASDTDTTDGSGNYSFDVSDGSYTVTPSKSGSFFSEGSEAVTISGASQSGVDFIGFVEVSTPLTFDFDAETTGATPSWVTNTGTDTATVQLYSIEGHSKGLKLPGVNGAVVYCDITKGVGGYLDPTKGLRVQVLGYRGALYAPKYMFASAGSAAGQADTNLVLGEIIESSTNHKTRSFIRKDATVWDTGQQGSGAINGTGNGYTYWRWEFDPATQMWFHSYNTGGSPHSGYPKTRAHATGWQTPTYGFDHMTFVSASYYETRIIEVWIGYLTDSWPTPGSPTT